MRILLFVIFLFPIQAAAQDICGEQDYSQVEPPNFSCPGPGEVGLIPELPAPASIPVSLGQQLTAPWEGALVHRNRMLELGFNLRALRRLRWLDNLRLYERYAIEIEYQKRIADAQILQHQHNADAALAVANSARNELAAERRWYRSVWFGFVLGIVAASVVFAVSILIFAYVIGGPPAP